MPKLLSNWDKLRNRDVGDTITYRDVYADQQLDRTTIGKKNGMGSRIIADVALTIFFFFIVWLVYSFAQYAHALLSSDPNLRAENAAEYTNVLLDLGGCLRNAAPLKVFTALTTSVAFFFIMYIILKRTLAVKNADNEVADINQYPNDQHIALPEEIQRKFDWFPDVGATSDVQFSSMISHIALSNKGLKHIMVAKRASENILDEDGEIVTYKGEVLRDDAGNIIYEEREMIDREFMDALYDASGLPRDKELRKYYNATQIPYNPDGRDRDKLGKFNTVADLINKDWQFPWYEPTRPGGAYLVDTAPVNTMVLAITRAGKGKCGLC